MRLESLLPLIHGTLLTTPTISAFNDITDKASKVARGDLFISIDSDSDEIQTAIERGAYGIVIDKHYPTIDDEIAWIKVDSSFEAHLKLLRFHLMPKQLDVYYADSLTLAYISILKNSRELKVIDHDLSDIVTKLWDIHEASKIVIKEQDDILTLFPTAKQLEFSHNEITLHPVTPFESDLMIKDAFYPRCKVPGTLARPFITALHFLKNFDIPYDLGNIVFPSRFDVQFCDTYLRPKEFGKGSRTLIFIEDEEQIDLFMELVASIAPWIRTNLFLKHNLNNLRYNEYVIFNDNDSLLEQLQHRPYDYAVIYGASKEILQNSSQPLQQSLF